MSERTRGEHTRTQLVEAAIRLLADGGAEALQARKLAAEIGASTMAVYTHFGGMAALMEAVAREGFRRLIANMATVEQTDDPVADLYRLALAYRQTAVEHPELFTLMFREAGAHGHAVGDLLKKDPDTEAAASFHGMVAALARTIDAGRLQGDPLVVASQVWSAVHGYVTLELLGHFGRGDRGVTEVLAPLCVTLVVGLGDSPAAARASVGLVTTTE
ncbi:TetR/AcrR family transcriptional regulator [Amycolatopsis echigonensis]|uniref:TetR/AcrR family transcriptional regulator n=1 Tax=Amycolatopsis echigonensis TaxID=2576905 RepID=A0A8E1W4S5_9PSEU|nr:TetR/AcrR family transcriptional regulator [Amycolatopsis echigonensis]MBB2504130.1 TetR/AcrR family transcriptional regulator [Amycolatopsis echigonensis]